MENLNVELTPAMLALVPVVATIIQVIKRILKANGMPIIINSLAKEFMPFVSIGIALGIMIYQSVPQSLLPAIIIGLTACGGFDLLRGKK